MFNTLNRKIIEKKFFYKINASSSLISCGFIDIPTYIHSLTSLLHIDKIICKYSKTLFIINALYKIYLNSLHERANNIYLNIPSGLDIVKTTIIWAYECIVQVLMKLSIFFK